MSQARRRLPIRAFAWGASLALASTMVHDAWADVRTDARSLFKRGMSAIASGRYEEGIDDLKKAHETLPHPSVLYNIARAYGDMGDLPNAVAYFEKYAATAPADETDVRAIISHLQTRLARQRAALEAALRPPSPTPSPTLPAETAAPGVSERATEEPGVASRAGPTTRSSLRDGEPPTTAPTGNDGSSGNAASPSASLSTPTTAAAPVFYEEQVVTASRGEAQSPLELPNSTAIITEQDIRLSGITKIPELLRRVAGIDIMQMTGGTTEVSMRGFNQRLSNKLLVLVDGRSTFVDYFGATAWESFSIDVDQIERIEVVRGPGSALYGADAFGGVVNIITRAPGTGRNGIRVGFGDHNQAFGSMQVTGRDGDFAYRASAGYTRHPNWTMDYSPSRVDLDANKRYPDVSTELSRIDLRTTRKLGKDISLDVGGGLTRGFLNVINLGGFREWDYSDTATGDLTAALQFKKVRTRVFYNYYRWGRVSAAYVYKGQDSYVSPFAANVVDAESVYADQVPLGPTTHQINLGLNYRLRNASAIYTGRDRTEHHFGIFGQDSVKLTPTTTLVLSGRIDRVPYTGMFEGSPRTSMLWNPAPRSTVRTSFSTAFRKPTFLEGYAKFPVQPPQGSLSSITDTEALERLYGSSGRLRVERVLTAEVGYINQQSDIVDVDVAAYYNRVSDLITLAPPMPLTLSQRKDGEANLDLGTGRYPAQQTGFVNQCVIFHVVGGEAGVRTYPFKGLDLFANYALNMVHEERPGACEIPADQRTSHHKLNAGAQVRTPLGIQGEVTFHYVSDQRWVERDLDSSSGTLVYRTLPLAGYPLVNARVGYRFAGDHAEVAATAFNLLGHEHQQHPLGQTVGQRFMGFFRYEF